MGRKYSPYNNFIGSMLKFFFPKTQPVAPKGYMTVDNDGTVNIDPRDVVMVPQGNYSIKPGDHTLVLPAYLDPLAPEDQTFYTLELPDPAISKGRELKFWVVGSVDEELWAAIWLLHGLYSNYAEVAVAASGVNHPSSDPGYTIPPFGTVELTTQLSPSGNLSIIPLYCDGIGWVNGELYQPQPYTP